MKAIKYFVVLLAYTLLASCAHMSTPVTAPAGIIADNDHESWVKHYENVATEAQTRLQENRKILQEYEARPYYYGRRGQDLQSHTSANIRAYEKILRDSLRFVELHTKMASEQRNQRANRAETNPDHNLIAEKSDHSNEEL
jgi:hypothetical protein